MIAHFLHGGGGPVWSNRAQLPHLDLTFPLTPSLILSLSLSLILSLTHIRHTQSSRCLERSHLPIFGSFQGLIFFFPPAFHDLSQLLLFASLIFVHSCFLSLSFLRFISQSVIANLYTNSNNLLIALLTDYTELWKKFSHAWKETYGCFLIGGQRMSDSFDLLRIFGWSNKTTPFIRKYILV